MVRELVPIVDMTVPKIGSAWRHAKGIEYVVDDIRNEQSTNPEYPIQVCYVGPNGHKWSKPLGKWHSRMTAIDKVSWKYDGVLKNDITA